MVKIILLFFGESDLSINIAAKNAVSIVMRMYINAVKPERDTKNKTLAKSKKIHFSCAERL